VRIVNLFCLSVLAAATAVAADSAGYRLLKTVPVPGDGGWDYVTVDEMGRRVYVSHATQVDVLDADTGELKGKISDTKGVHGIAIAPELGRGFTSNGQADTVTIFDLKTLKTLSEVKTGRGPDAIMYDSDTKRVFAFNGRGKSATVIDAAKGDVAGTIELGGQPETGVADGTGVVFVNLEDKNELLKLDAKNMKVMERWPLAPAATPTGLAFDKKNRRLFVGCRSKHLAIVNADNGKVITTLPIGERVDAAAFDAETGLIFASCGDGTVSVVHQDGPDKYTAMETIKTRTGSKTMALDPKTHKLFIPGAEFMEVTGQRRPVMKPGTFVVMIYGK
jgi:DNA-binding beta-propeller fold protein YncE